jgi:tRNA-splicing ligase RtcB (3'-phosphate/5'-hydroxy nucleic acid ligase)
VAERRGTRLSNNGLAAHTGSIRVKHTLRPLGVAMAGRDVLDPYKD